jgi:hypothetical protein
VIAIAHPKRPCPQRTLGDSREDRAQRA